MSEIMFEDKPEHWIVDSSTEVFRNRLIAVRNDKVRMPGNHVAERTVVSHPGAVAVLAVDGAGRALMIRQYRHPAGQVMWELPAGLRDHPGEPLVEAAKRELAEETGYRAATWHSLVDHYSSPGITNERLRVFLARDLDLAPDSGYVREHEESLIVNGWLWLPDAVQAILAGRLHNGATIAGLLAGYIAWSKGFTGLREADAPEECAAAVAAGTTPRRPAAAAVSRRERVRPDVLEDEACLGVGDVRVAGQALDEVAQCLRGCRRDVQQEVVLASEEEDVQHLGEPCHPGHERPQVAAGVSLQADRHHRLQGPPKSRGVDVGVVTADDAALPQALTRARHVDGAMPARSARALFGSRASRASSRRISRSVSSAPTASGVARTLFGMVTGSTGLPELDTAISSLYKIIFGDIGTFPTIMHN